MQNTEDITRLKNRLLELEQENSSLVRELEELRGRPPRGGGRDAGRGAGRGIGCGAESGAEPTLPPLYAWMDSLPAVAFAKDLEGKIVYANPVLEELFGIESQEFVGMTDYDLYSDDRETAERMRANDRMVRELGSPITVGETVMVHGEKRHFVTLKFPVRDERGETVFVGGIATEATDLRKAEMARLESERRFRLAFEASAIGMALVGIDGSFLEINPAVARILGYSTEELLRKNFKDITHPDDAEESARLFGAFLAGQDESYSFEKRYVHKDGETVWGLLTVAAIRDPAGTPLYIHAQLRDITARKQALKALTDSEKKYRELLEALQEGIWVIDGDSRTTFVNEPMARMLGYTMEEMIGKPLFSFMDERGVKLATQKVERRRKGITEQHEFEFLHKNGERIFTLMETSPLTDDRGGYAGAIAGVLDITERRSLESRLLHSQKLEAIGTMAGGIAHDFNNILGIIVGNAELALTDVPEWNTARGNLEEIHAACLRAQDVVKQILAFGLRDDRARKPVTLAPMIRESARLMRALIPTTVEIVVDTPRDCDTVRADPTQIHQVLLNLCTNAAHAMEEGGGTLCIKLEEAEPGEKAGSAAEAPAPAGSYLKLSVSDTGKGIDGAVLPRIFDPYFTTKNLGKGSGMGLAVVHGIVKSHEGFVRVESEKGRGTRVDIYLPRTAEAPEAQAPAGRAQPRGTERVLLVDDEQTLLEVGRRLLERLGYRVETAAGGEEALVLFRKDPDRYDVIISDVTMPRVTGGELAREVLARRPGQPFILSSGFSEATTREEARDIGVAAFLEKPLKMKTLAGTLRDVLDREEE